MRILVFENKPTLLRGGQERSLYEVISGLRRRGVGFHLAYREPGELSAEYEKICEITLHIRYRIVEHRHPERFLADLFRLIRTYMATPLRVDLVYVNQFYDLPLAVAFGSLLGIPVVCHLRLPAPCYLSRQYRWSLSRCSALIANSYFTASDFQNVRRRGGLLEVVHNSVDTNYFRPAEQQTPSTSNRRVLYLGRLSPEKGIEHLIRAMPMVARQCLGAHLWIVGNDLSVGQEHGAYLRRLAETVAPGLVEFKEGVSDVRPTLGAADLLVLPSVWDEPFGRVLIEAMACGVPCVASAVGGIPEVLGDVSPDGLVPARDEAALAKAILAKLEWREEDPTLGARCRQHVLDNFVQQKMFDALLSVFERTIQKR